MRYDGGIDVSKDLYAIKNKNAAGCAFIIVDCEPTWLENSEYVKIPKTPLLSEFFGEFWCADDGSYTLQMPYTHKYHVFRGGKWRIDERKVSEHIAETKEIFTRNFDKYKSFGLSPDISVYMQKQVELIESLDDVEEFSIVKFGGKYEGLYDVRLDVAI